MRHQMPNMAYTVIHGNMWVDFLKTTARVLSQGTLIFPFCLIIQVNYLTMAPLLSMLSRQRKVCEWIDARDVLIVPEGPLSGLGEKGTAIDAWRTDKLQCV